MGLIVADCFVWSKSATKATCPCGFRSSVSESGRVHEKVTPFLNCLWMQVLFPLTGCFVIPTSYDQMASMTIHSSVTGHVEPKMSMGMVPEDNEFCDEVKVGELELQLSPEVNIPDNKLMFHAQFTTTESLDKGYLQYGCSHYRRRCRVRAPCCNEIFPCRHCHNDAKNSICINQKLRHDMPRHLVEKVICSLCDTEQEVQQVCKSCGVCMGKYFCGICKLFDDDTYKEQYHCDGCGICRIGGRKNFVHCDKCGCCYSALLKSDHPCVERAMHQDCPVCFEYLFESRHDVIALLCGHTIHKSCLEQMQEHFQYACPICAKSVCDMSKVWEKFDHEIASTPMPSYYENKTVWILCNDCGSNSEVKYHVVAHKCPHCSSYNTRQTRGPVN